MEACIWGELPEHLMEHIVTRLPIVTRLRCRSLSSKWLSFISSLPSSPPPRSPWFLIFANHAYDEACSFDPSTLSWYSIPLPSFSIGDERHIPVASAGGLVCFTSSLDGRKTFTVCNPFTRAWRKLPPMLNPPSFLENVGMVIMDETSTTFPEDHSSYKVIVTGSHDMSEEVIFTEVFDSTTNQWEASSTMPRGADPMLSAVACNGSLYSWCCEPDGLLCYNLKHHSWILLPTSTPHSALISNALLSWQGRLFMLGGLNENQQHLCLGACFKPSC